MTRNAFAGLLLGVGWGVLARVWMRMVSTDPSFSWAGTLFIVGLAGVAGLGLGLVRGARVTGRSRWWRLSALLAFPLVASPQGVLAFTPALVAGGFGLSRRGPAWLRAACLLGVAAIPVWMWFFVMREIDRLLIPMPTAVVGLDVLCLGLAVGGAELYRRRTLPVSRTREEAGVVA